MAKDQDRSPTPQERDEKRKQDILILQSAISGFRKLEGRDPNAQEFERLRHDLDPPVVDPLEGQETDWSKEKYGYYYSQTPAGLTTPQPDYFRLWCFLESSQEKYEKTSQDEPLTESTKRFSDTATTTEDELPSVVDDFGLPQIQGTQIEQRLATYLTFLSLAVILFNVGLSLAIIWSLRELDRLLNILETLLGQLRP